MINRRWNSMNNLMHKAVNRLRFAPQLEAAAVCQAADQQGAQRYRAVSFREGVLKLVVRDYDDAAWLRPQLSRLISELNTDLSADAIRSIILEVKPDIDIHA